MKNKDQLDRKICQVIGSIQWIGLWIFVLFCIVSIFL
jgi:hypothetical protein